MFKLKVFLSEILPMILAAAATIAAILGILGVCSYGLK